MTNGSSKSKTALPIYGAVFLGALLGGSMLIPKPSDSDLQPQSISMNDDYVSDSHDDANGHLNDGYQSADDPEAQIEQTGRDVSQPSRTTGVRTSPNDLATSGVESNTHAASQLLANKSNRDSGIFGNADSGFELPAIQDEPQPVDGREFADRLDERAAGKEDAGANISEPEAAQSTAVQSTDIEATTQGAQPTAQGTEPVDQEARSTDQSEENEQGIFEIDAESSDGRTTPAQPHGDNKQFFRENLGHGNADFAPLPPHGSGASLDNVPGRIENGHFAEPITNVPQHNSFPATGDGSLVEMRDSNPGTFSNPENYRSEFSRQGYPQAGTETGMYLDNTGPANGQWIRNDITNQLDQRGVMFYPLEDENGQLNYASQVSYNTSGLTIADFEAMAIENHPTLHAARAMAVAEKNRAEQAALPNNVVLGMFGEEIGNDDEGIYGAYISRDIRRGGKRQLGYEAGMRESEVAQAGVAQLQMRLLTDVRISYFDVLIAQKQLEMLQQLADVAEKSITMAEQLVGAEESPQTDLLQVRIQAGKLRVQMEQTRAALCGAWRSLATVINRPGMAQQYLSGSPDTLPEFISWDDCVLRMSASPDLSTANAKVTAADARLRQQLAGRVPDLQTQFSIGHDTATDDMFGSFQVGAPLNMRNRNQGNIGAARAEYRAAVESVNAVRLGLQKQLAVEFQSYETAWKKSRAFTERIMPEADRTLDLVTRAYREGEVEFLQYFQSQQTNIDLTTEYLASLRQLWTSRMRIEGMLLSDSLE